MDFVESVELVAPAWLGLLLELDEVSLDGVDALDEPLLDWSELELGGVALELLELGGVALELEDEDGADGVDSEPLIEPELEPLLEDGLRLVLSRDDEPELELDEGDVASREVPVLEPGPLLQP